MVDPRAIAQGILGPIDWDDKCATRGWCRCPGISAHTKRNSPRDCSVFLDGAPNIHCFHASCAAIVRDYVRKLRTALNGGDWALIYAGGRTIRNGDIPFANGKIVTPDDCAKIAAETNTEPAVVNLSESIRAQAEFLLPNILHRFRWAVRDIQASSPIRTELIPPDGQFRAFTNQMFHNGDHIWCGDVSDSGKPWNAKNFRTREEWILEGQPPGNFTCACSFKPGTFSRAKENIGSTRYLVVESDSIPIDKVGAIFRYMSQRLFFKLHAIIHSGNKSLHAWFDFPQNPRIVDNLKQTLIGFQCDEKMFTASQPVRVPGAWRGDKAQELLWMK